MFRLYGGGGGSIGLDVSSNVAYPGNLCPLPTLLP
jgi:hypothetical protein